MKSQVAFCSACDKDVRIVITDEPSQDGHANIHESEVVCLEIGESCTGNLCPIGAAPPAVMAARLVRSDSMKTIVQPIVEAKCPTCERVTPHFLVGKHNATCGECGVTSARSELVYSPEA
jgi:hypothetical protein